MNFMNEYEIDEAVDILRGTDAGRYAQVLSDFKDRVNSKSDGWPHWAPPVRAASKLIAAVRAASEVRRGFSRATMPTPSAFEASLTPIRSFATKHKWDKIVVPAPVVPDGSDEPDEGTAPRF